MQRYLSESNVLSSPRPRFDMRGFNPDVIAYYCIAAASNRGDFAPHAVADLELRYWVIHRELAETPKAE
jgi:hypothetical protein